MQRSFTLELLAISIGEALRGAREQAYLSIEEVAWRTRIRPEYLRALEADRYQILGEAVFVRGHLLSYARVLGLDPQEILRAYDEHYLDHEPSPLEHLDAAKKAEKHPPRPRWLLTASFALAVLLAIGAVGLLHGPGEKSAAHVALQPLPPRLSGLHEASRANTDALVETRSRPAVASAITIALSVTDRCWVQIVADGKTVLSEVLEKGTARTFTATRTLQITVGKPAVVNLSFNGTSVALPHASATGVWLGTFGPQGLL